MNTQKRKLIIFDVDGTLTKSRSDIDTNIAQSLCRLLEKYNVGIISGGEFEELKERVADKLPCTEALNSLFILPTSGGHLLTSSNGKWQTVYQDTLSNEERDRVKKIALEVIAEIEENPPTEIYGERIEDRKTQLTFSGLGQEAPLELKREWDPGQEKRKSMQTALKKRLPGYEVGIGGTTSIDITRRGHDKAYGIKKLIDYLNVPLENVLFVGDKLAPGGNDYPARTLCIDYKKVNNPKETKRIIDQMLGY